LERKANGVKFFITGFEKSDFGTILQKNLKGSNFNFEDPYQQNNFFIVQTMRLAALGVTAISTSNGFEAKYQLSDDISTLI
jgi:hypothetical protein